MKKIYFLFIFTVFNYSIKAQIIDILDANFKAFLLNSSTSNGIAKNSFGANIKIDSNNNSEIETSEALNVFQLNVATNILNTTNNISNLTGLEYFTNLTFLNCSGNQITTLDLTPLLYLEEIKANDNALTNVNIAGLINLKKINFNHNSLDSIDIDNLANLIELFVYDNNLTVLNFGNNPNLESINCRINTIITLDLSSLTSLNWISCDANQLTDLNLTGLVNIEEIECSNNNLTSLNVSGLTTLRGLSFGNNQISTIELSSLSDLEMLNCSNNPLANLNVNNLNSLSALNASSTLISSLDCTLSGITNIVMTNCLNLESINLKNNLLSSSDPDMLFFAFMIENNPLLASICVDEGEQNNLAYYNYNTSGNVVVYTGPSCSTVVEPLSTNQFLGQSKFVIFPNPAKDYLVIQNEKNVEINTIQIYNTLGQLIKTVPKNDYLELITIDLTALKIGTYFLNIISDKDRFTQKFIIIK